MKYHFYQGKIFAALLAFPLLFSASCKGKEDAKTSQADTSKTVTKAVPGAPIKYDSSKRYIYLTFDDGPQPPGTVMCKKIFHELGVKATFFMVGMHEFDQYRKNIVDTVRNSYPEFLLANHSYSHGFRNNYKFFYSHPDSAVKDFMKAQTLLNVPVKIVRFPGNNMWIAKGEIRGPKSTRKVAQAMDSLGFNAIGWDVEWQFKEQHGSVPVQGAEELASHINEMFENMITNQPNHLVILAHDRMFAKPQYADSLIRFINILKQDPRNVFETVDHYPNLK